MSDMHTKPLTLREILLAGVSLFGLAVLFCGPSLLWNWDHAPFDHGDPGGSYFPYWVRTEYPPTPQVAGAWDPTLWTGLPESHTPFGRYYPVSRLLFVLFPLGLALTLTFPVHHALAGLGMYVLMRTSGFRKGSALIAALVFGFSSFLVFHRAFVMMFQTAAWLPWILWAFEKYRRERTWPWVVIAGTLIGVHGLAAHSQILVMGAMTWVLYAVYFTILEGGTFAARLRLGLGIGVACVLGAIGSLPQTLPMMEVGQWTPYTTPDWDYFRSGSFELKFLAGLAGPWMLGGEFGVPYAPRILGPHDAGCFFGLLPLSLAVVGLCAAVAVLRLKPNSAKPRERGSQPVQPAANPPSTAGLNRCAESPVNGAEEAPSSRAAGFTPAGAAGFTPAGRTVTAGMSPATPRHEIGFWLALLCVHGLLMLGRNSPLYLALFTLPVYNMFHVPARHLWIVSLALAWLAALGFEQLRTANGSVGRRLWQQALVGFALLAVAAIAILVLFRGWHAKPGLGYPGFWIPVACGLGVLVLLAMALRSSRRRVAWLTVIVVLTFVELRLTLGDFLFSPMSTERAMGAEHFPEFVRHLRAAQQDGVPTRCLMEQGCWTSSVPKGEAPNAWGQMWGLSVLNCYSQSMPHSLAQLLHLDKYGFTQFNRVLWEQRGLSAVGGRFIVTKRAPRPAAPEGFVELAREDLWAYEQPLLFTCQPGQPSRSSTSVMLESAHPYLLEGELVRKGALEGEFRIRLVDFGRTVGDFVVRPQDFIGARCSFAFMLSPLISRYAHSHVGVQLECSGTMAVELTAFNFWCLREKPGDLSAPAIEALGRRLRDQRRSPYPLRIQCSPPIYENPHARGLATLVREVRAATDDLDAARGIVQSSDRPVRELAFVVAPLGQSYDLTLSGSRAFSTGTAAVTHDRPDDIHVRTKTEGEGFLVLTVTRCRGWTATVDGAPVPIHAVDGPLMGVRVPAGEHVVRFQFRPVLVHAGAALAGGAYALAWGICLVSAWRRRRCAPLPTDVLDLRGRQKKAA